MRILYIITQGEQGGGQKNVLDLALGMKEKGHQVYVAVGEIENEGDKWLFTELEIGGIPKENLLELKQLQREVKPARDLSAVSEIIHLFKKIKPEIVHLHSSKAGVVGGLACAIYNMFFGKVKSVYTVHGFVFLEPMNIVKKIIFICLEFVSSICRNFTILISPLDIQAGKKFWILRNRKKYKTIYNGLTEKIKSEMLSREEARKYLVEKIPPLPFGKANANIVGTISNLYRTKGLEHLIDAAKKVVAEKGNTIFVVLGFGDENYKKELEERIKQNKLEDNFFFLGRTPSAFKYLKGFDVFTLTSVKEGLPYTLLEARMSGVPILASSVGGIPEMAKNFDINLVPVGDVDKIAEKILNILSSKAKTSDELPKVYSLENMLNETEGVYTSLI